MRDIDRLTRDLVRRTVLVLLVAVVATACGCEPLRKKFTRKKKQDATTTDLVPVLDPVDYPDKITSPVETYKYHYSLWQVWDKDLATGLEERTSDKRLSYLFQQAVNQLEEMQKLLAGDKQKGLEAQVAQLKDLQKKVLAPVPRRERSQILQRLERISKGIRRDFRPPAIQDHLVK